MNVEVLIYAYMAICASMIVFNCVCVFVFKHREEKLNHRNSDLAVQMRKEMEKIQSGEMVSEKHKRYLQKKLRYTGNLLTFDENIDVFCAEHSEGTKTYLTQNRAVFIYLVLYFQGKNRMKMAYLAYLLGKYKLSANMPIDIISETMLTLVQEKSLYCRENALHVLYSTGNEDCVAKAIKMIDQSGEFHHGKLLCDGLLTFAGDHKRLIKEIWNMLGELSAEMKVALLNYIRFESGGYEKEMMTLFADETQDDEVRFACIRYFGKYHYEPAMPLLLKLCSQEEEDRWEYTAIAADVLHLYPGKETIEVLKEALHSFNWYVRLNAAQSLERMGFTYSDLADIFTGNDRYAAEILEYTLEHKEIYEEERKGEKAAV